MPVPALYMFASTNRVLWPQFVLNAPYYLLGARALVRWRQRGFVAMGAPWAAGARGGASDPRVQFHVCGVVVTLLTGTVLCIPAAWLAAESNRGGWLVPSPCFGSSCSQAQYVADVVYNPWGFYGGAYGGAYTDYEPTVCMYDGCAWADGTGVNITGYAGLVNDTLCPDVAAPCASPQCLATNRTQGYPNLAVGIGGGMFPCFGESVIGRSAPCPGTFVNVDPATQAVTLKGRQTASYCLGWFRARAGYTNPATDAYPSVVGSENNYVWCGTLCPQIGEVRTPRAMLKQSLYCDASATVPVLTWVFVEVFALVATGCLAMKEPPKLKKADGRGAGAGAGGGKHNANVPMALRRQDGGE